MRGIRGTNWRLMVALLAVLALLGAACGDDDGGEIGADIDVEEFDDGTTMAELQDKGEIVIGVKFDVPPFGFEDPESGEVQGFDVDLGKYIAARLGVDVEFKEAISDNRIPFLTDGTWT